MNILSAIFAGRMGFENSTKKLAQSADRIAKNGPNAEDLVSLKKEKAFSEANTSTIRVADNLLNAFIKDSSDQKRG